MLRVRVKAKNFFRLEATGRPAKKPGGPVPRAPVKYAEGTELSVTEAYYQANKASLQLLGKDLGEAAGAGKTPPSTVSDLEALRAEAEELGIAVNKRWREARLREEIANARAELEDDDDIVDSLEDLDGDGADGPE